MKRRRRGGVSRAPAPPKSRRKLMLKKGLVRSFLWLKSWERICDPPSSLPPGLNPMTRASLNRTLRRAYVVLRLVLVISLASKFADRIPGIAGTPIETARANDLYELPARTWRWCSSPWWRPTSPTCSRSARTSSRAWRRSGAASCARNPRSSTYLREAVRLDRRLPGRVLPHQRGHRQHAHRLWQRGRDRRSRRPLSIRAAARHAPRAAVHRSEERSDISAEEKKLARDAILQSFYALRENMLEELDLDEPAHPLLISGGRRHQAAGGDAERGPGQDRQRKRQDKLPATPGGRGCAAFASFTRPSSGARSGVARNGPGRPAIRAPGRNKRGKCAFR